MKYHKIHSPFKRNTEGKLILNDWAKPEFGYLCNNQWGFTEKVDGTNIRIYLEDRGVRFAGRTDAAQIPATLIAKLSELFHDKTELMRRIFDKEDAVCLYGEGYGPKIQKGGGNYRNDQSFVLFDIRIGKWWLKRKDVLDVGKTLGLDVVPTIGHGTLFDMLELARRGFNSKWGDFPAEGLVARPLANLLDRAGNRITTKIKLKDFPLAE